MTTTPSANIAGNVIDVDGETLLPPTKALLQGLSLLPTDQDLKDSNGLAPAFKGPPDSVAIIEAGATAASKWWATAIGISASAISARIATLWDGLDGPWVQPFALLSISIVLGSAAIGISYLLASDVRGRAAAMVSIIEARRDVAIKMAELASAASKGRTPATGTVTSIGPLKAKNPGKSGAEAEAGWTAIAMRDTAAGIEYLLVKNETSEWKPAEKVGFT